MTLVLYESPQRLLRTLEDMLRHWGSRRIAVARELTKIHEEIFRGTIEQAMEHFSGEVKGEITLVVEGVSAGAENDVNSSGRPGSPTSDDIGGGDWEKELDRLLAVPGMTVREAARQVSARFNLPRREVYKAALCRKGQT